MTVFTVRLQTDSDETKHGAYLIYGEIAQACESLAGLKLVEITDDVAASSEPSTPAKPRKPRGKNKPKVQDVTIPWSEPVQAIGSGKAVPLEPIPASLKRTAE